MNLQEFHVAAGFCWLAERMLPSQNVLFHSSCSADKLQIPATAIKSTCQPSSKSLSIYLQCRRQGEAGTFTWTRRFGRRGWVATCHAAYVSVSLSSNIICRLHKLTLQAKLKSLRNWQLLLYTVNIRSRSALVGAVRHSVSFPSYLILHDLCNCHNVVKSEQIKTPH
jgi:hypothetical protein